MNPEAMTAMDSASDSLQEMKRMLGEDGPLEPQAFLQAAVDTRCYLDRAVQEGLASVLGHPPRQES